MRTLINNLNFHDPNIFCCDQVIISNDSISESYSVHISQLFQYNY